MNNGDRPPAGAVRGLEARSFSLSLTASDLEASVRFYTEGLGFEVQERHAPEGHLRFVMMRAGQALLGLARDDFAKGRDRVKGVGLRIYLTTDQDIHALADRLRTAGYATDGEPGPLPWGPLGFSVRDPDGFAITIANEE